MPHMETITLYRLVHKTVKCGPWHTKNTDQFNTLSETEKGNIRIAHRMLDEYFWNHDEYAYEHPSVHMDFGCWTSAMLCATDSLYVLRSWFARSEAIMTALFDANFTVVAITVPVETIINGRSGRQVAYKKDHVIAEEDLTILALYA